MASPNSECKISIRASVPLCKFVSSSQGYQKYSRRLFYICRKASWKILLPYEAILRGLASTSIDSSFFVTWLHFQFKVLTRYSQYFWLLRIYLVGPCNFVNFIRNFFFSIWVFPHDHSRITGLQGKGDGSSLAPHHHPFQRHLDINRAITADSAPLHISSNQTPLIVPSSSRDYISSLRF